MEETKSLDKGSQRDWMWTWNLSEGRRPNIPEIVLFIASKVVSGTSFWIWLTSNGSISWITSAIKHFWERAKKKPNFKFKFHKEKIKTEFFKKKKKTLGDRESEWSAKSSREKPSSLKLFGEVEADAARVRGRNLELDRKRNGEEGFVGLLRMVTRGREREKQEIVVVVDIAGSLMAKLYEDSSSSSSSSSSSELMKP